VHKSFDILEQRSAADRVTGNSHCGVDSDGQTSHQAGVFMVLVE
jgi:hypothetical protein